MSIAKNEIETKLKRIRDLLHAEHLDALYLKRQDNFAWLTGGGKNYVGLGEIGNCGLLVTQEGTAAITNNIEGPRMVDEERLDSLGFPVHSYIWHDNSAETAVIDKLIGGSGKGVGFDHANPRGPNAASKIQPLRFSLTPEEIERYREGGYLASLAVEQVAAAVRPGDTEQDVAGALTAKLTSLGFAVHSAIAAADERIVNYRHAIPTGKPIKERLQMGGNYAWHGLVVCLTRYVNFVPVTAELRRQMRLNQEIDIAFMRASIPGHTFAQVLEAGRSAYAERGFAGEFDLHHQGGPIGYVPRDYRVTFANTGVIREHQAFCWNPSITGTKSEDTIIASTGGFEFITKPVIFPKITVTLDGVTYERADILER